LAIFRLAIRARSRAKGANAVAAAAYISRDKLRDEQLGQSFDFRKRGGLEHAEILVPQDSSGTPVAAIPERSALWNLAEKAERRKDARVAREYQFALPHELASRDRIALARRFAQDIANRYGGAVDLAVHLARPEGDPRNVHAHVLSTTREYHAAGLGRKTDMEISEYERRARGLQSSRAEFRQIRGRLAEFTNQALREHGIAARVDHRTLVEQGIDRRPGRPLGPAVIAIMRRGGHSTVMERVRAERAAERAAALEHEGKQGQASELTPLERQRRRALESWRAYRQAAHEPPARDGRETPDKEHEAGRTAERDYER
jgi:ATP-dependent exoDNAse (exonuclease V) alpha subunit